MRDGDHRKIDLTFSNRLNQIIIERQIYPSQLANITGISKRAIYGYLQGYSQPTAYTLKRIAVCLKISSDWLLGLKG